MTLIRVLSAESTELTLNQLPLMNVLTFHIYIIFYFLIEGNSMGCITYTALYVIKKLL